MTQPPSPKQITPFFVSSLAELSSTSCHVYKKHQSKPFLRSNSSAFCFPLLRRTDYLCRAMAQHVQHLPLEPCPVRHSGSSPSLPHPPLLFRSNTSHPHPPPRRSLLSWLFSPPTRSTPSPPSLKIPPSPSHAPPRPFTPSQLRPAVLKPPNPPSSTL